MEKYGGLNYTMLCDFYELTMGNGYFQTGMDQQISTCSTGPFRTTAALP